MVAVVAGVVAHDDLIRALIALEKIAMLAGTGGQIVVNQVTGDQNIAAVITDAVGSQIVEMVIVDDGIAGRDCSAERSVPDSAIFDDDVFAVGIKW